jgi:hypothetical protein
MNFLNSYDLVQGNPEVFSLWVVYYSQYIIKAVITIKN